jgi:hypothetical protein
MSMDAAPDQDLEMPPDSPAVFDRKSHARSRVTNGNELLPGVDGRSWYARRARDLGCLFVSDLGGLEAASEAEKAIVRRASILCVELENLEVRFAKDGAAQPDALDLYQRTSNSLRRLLESLGLRRRPRDVTPPPFSDYVRRHEEVAT